MFNVNKTVGKEYIPASEVKNKEILLPSIKIAWTALGLLILSILEALKNLIISQKPDNIANKLALVTGGGNGLGRALCFRLAKEGCDLAIVDIDIKNAVKTANEIKDLHKVNCIAFQCDVSDYASILKLKSDIESQMRSVDILVNNAGLLYMSNFVQSDIKDVRKVVDVNLTSHFLVSS